MRDTFQIRVNDELSSNFYDLKNATNRNDQIGCYNEILLSIEEMNQQWCSFLMDCWLFDDFATIQAESQRGMQEATKARENWKKSGLLDEVFQPDSFPSIATAEFVSRNRYELKAHLIEDSIGHSKQLATRCAKQLVQLTSMNAMGLTEWYEGNICRYTFFRRSVFAEKGLTQNQLICHEHHLVDAFVCHPSNAPVSIPDNVGVLISRAPKWLAPELRLVVGTMILEEISEKVVKVEQWKVRKRIPRMHDDPALVIGPVVLTGWLPTIEPANASKTSTKLKALSSNPVHSFWKMLLGSSL